MTILAGHNVGVIPIIYEELSMIQTVGYLTVDTVEDHRSRDAPGIDRSLKSVKEVLEFERLRPLATVPWAL